MHYLPRNKARQLNHVFLHHVGNRIIMIIDLVKHFADIAGSGLQHTLLTSNVLQTPMGVFFTNTC